jgi:membrane protein implicated in regulation of membrane protease activity
MTAEIWFVLAVATLIAGAFADFALAAAIALAALVAGITQSLIGDWRIASAAFFVVALVGIFLALRLRRRILVPQAIDDDVGQSVEVLLVRDDHSLRVRYRGTEWEALPRGAVAAQTGGRLLIAGRHGNTLLVRED